MAKGSVNGSWSVSETSETSYTLSCSGSYSFGPWYLWGVRVACYIGGSQVATNAGYTTGKYQTTAYCSGSRTISRTHSDQSIYCEVKSWGETVDDIGSVGESDSTGGWITVPAKRSFTVSYNANGGSGAPGSQTKWYGENLTLSNSKPTRTGYTFAGWNTSANGSGTNYGSGAIYSGNSGITLYAKWKADTWSVTYNANGGTGAPEKQIKTYGVDLTLSSTKPTRKDYNFLGWGTSPSATTVSYAAGATYKNNATLTLYAVWELAWVAPDISNLSVSRTDKNGTLSEDGTNVKVSFDWTVDKLYDLTSITVKYKKTEDAEYGDPVTVQGASTEKKGTVNAIVGSNSISTEYAYDIYITVSDANGSTDQIRSIGSKYYTMDFKAGGKGIALGKPATKDNRIEIGLPVDFDDPAHFKREVYFDTSGAIAYVNNPDGKPVGEFRYVELPTGLLDYTFSAKNYYDYYNRLIEKTNEFSIGLDKTGNATYRLSDPKAFRDALGIGKLLWSGSLSIGGSITISDLPKYTVFGFRVSTWTTVMLGINWASNGSGYLRAYGNYGNVGGNYIEIYGVTCSTSNYTKLRYDGGLNYNIRYSSIISYGNLPEITEIYGIA